MSDSPIRVVLDTTAIAAYAKGSVGVGEIITEVADEHASFAVPTVCLIEAARSVDEAHVQLLTAHPACRVLPLLAEDWRPWCRASGYSVGWISPLRCSRPNAPQATY